MGPTAALIYIGGALGYALAVTAVSLGLARLWRGSLGWRGALLVLASAFPIFLGLHPFPDPATLSCTAPPPPVLRPFAFLDAYRVFWDQGRPLVDWLTSRSIMPPVMNVLLFAPAGMALARVTRRWPLALGLALGVTLFIETAQLTGLYGLYPCAYRQFEVDDLILNTIGVLAGFALLRGLGAGRGR